MSIKNDRHCKQFLNHVTYITHVIRISHVTQITHVTHSRHARYAHHACRSPGAALADSMTGQSKQNLSTGLSRLLKSEFFQKTDRCAVVRIRIRTHL